MLHCRASMSCGQRLVTRTTCFPPRTTNYCALPAAEPPKWASPASNDFLLLVGLLFNNLFRLSLLLDFVIGCLI